ncbi:OLC1v1000490C1 [Oldenlandia corymbosa var. corymbosa]|uniref:OLC1v1000490C1 n=1 Tax=Oldenlandia corymbosa var. corymbosa TaxID=529605 RepID=A0AAV1D5G6_OLDCO|nr:OLC1v1000490C1 [Oldenlandia corymbosa var. corymbosa]
MACLRVGFAIYLSLFVILLFSVPALCDDEEDHLMQGLNSYRQSHNAQILQKNDKADCLADEIADEIEDKPCPATGYLASKPGPPTVVNNYPDLLKKCKIDPNTTQEAVILPVCVSKRVATLVLTNYTQTPNSGFLNNTRFTGAGIGTEDDWTVLVLTTNTVGGSLANEGCFGIVLSLRHLGLGLIVGFFLLFGVL